ncbi:AMP-binding enzyme, partial [Amycolatopsis sp.]|uniref:AMP-binding enzyme n=1 Tax=Amycolatopsis sp. TaxID=37632 RepID=UPI002D7F8E6F
VTNFAGAPTVYRALSKSGLVRDVRLRRASSAGEPLTPDIAGWARDALGVEVRDHYGQTELGMVINNHWHPDVARPVKPGSMGQPMPGYTAGTVDGQIAVDVENSPLLWFTGYHEEPRKTAERFTGDGRWYLTADTGRVDDEGYYFFTARNDDVILAAGYRIGPFDVESVLITHPAVADVAVVGRPDPEGVRGEVVEAFVVLTEEAEANDGLAAELQRLVRDEYSKHAYPRSVHFIDALPKTPSGKVQRYLLRQR